MQESGGKKHAPIGVHGDCLDEHVKEEHPVSVCMIGTGEYTTGYVYGEAADSDKGAGGKLSHILSVGRKICH